MGRRKIDLETIDLDAIDQELADINAALSGDNPEHGGGAYPDEDRLDWRDINSNRYVGAYPPDY